jgi:hypothetical protein
MQFNVEVLKLGVLIQDKKEIAKFYLENDFAYDFVALVSLILFRYNQFQGENCLIKE